MTRNAGHASVETSRNGRLTFTIKRHWFGRSTINVRPVGDQLGNHLTVTDTHGEIAKLAEQIRNRQVFREYVEDDDTIRRAALLAARLNREIREISAL